jgi:hypothetical protein
MGGLGRRGPGTNSISACRPTGCSIERTMKIRNRAMIVRSMGVILAEPTRQREIAVNRRPEFTRDRRLILTVG